MGTLQRSATFSARAVRAGLTPSLVSYFFWIGIITTVFGVWAMMAYTPMDQYLCNIAGKENTTNGFVADCQKCKDTIMLCDKSQCWRQAFNLSWQLDASTPNGRFYDSFQEAALDYTCNSLVLASDSPVSMLSNILDRRQTPSMPQVSESCVTWNCRVLVRAFLRRLGPQLTGPGTCTNVNPTLKPAWQATACPCDEVNMTMAEASSFRTLCGSMSTGLRSAVYTRHLDSKDACFQGAMAAAAATYPIETGQFAQDVNCESILENTHSTLGWFQDKNYIEANLATGSTFSIPSYCRKVMCTAFVSTLQLPECNFTSNTRLTGGVVSAANLDAIATECAKEGLTLTDASMCAEQSFNESAYCAALFSGRRLSPEGAPGFHQLELDRMIRARAVPRLQVEDRALEVHPEKSDRSSPRSSAVLQEAVVGYEGVEVFQDDDKDQKCAGSVCNSERRLQTTNLQAYTTTPWSACTCYVQCVHGVRTRSVSCPTGVTCQEPPPSRAESCVCKHCSNCDVLVFVLVTAGAYLFHGVLSFLLWLGFVLVSFLEEDNFIKMSIGLKCLGCFCKFLPIVNKLMTYVTMFLVILLTVAALIPIGVPFSDCKGIATFTILAIGGVAIWVVQLAIGLYMNRYKPMPPWLHTASHSRVMRFICKPLNCVGP